MNDTRIEAVEVLGAIVGFVILGAIIIALV